MCKYRSVEAVLLAMCFTHVLPCVCVLWMVCDVMFKIWCVHVCVHACMRAWVYFVAVCVYAGGSGKQGEEGWPLHETQVHAHPCGSCKCHCYTPHCNLARCPQLCALFLVHCIALHSLQSGVGETPELMSPTEMKALVRKLIGVRHTSGSPTSTCDRTHPPGTHPP